VSELTAEQALEEFRRAEFKRRMLWYVRYHDAVTGYKPRSWLYGEIERARKYGA
jgi:hypothetical protein